LQKPEQFQRVFQQAIRTGDRCFRVLARRNELFHDRLGMAVSKKACPKAVGRNRIKRVVRESFRAHQAARPAAPALDIVVLPSADAARQSNAELYRSLRRHWDKLAAKTTKANACEGDGRRDRAALIED